MRAQEKKVAQEEMSVARELGLSRTSQSMQALRAFKQVFICRNLQRGRNFIEKFISNVGCLKVKYCLLEKRVKIRKGDVILLVSYITTLKKQMAITLGDQERSPIQGIFEKCKDLNSIRDKKTKCSVTKL